MLHVILAFSEHYVPSQDVPSLPSLRVLDGLALGWMVSRHRTPPLICECEVHSTNNLHVNFSLVPTIALMFVFLAVASFAAVLVHEQAWFSIDPGILGMLILLVAARSSP